MSIGDDWKKALVDREAAKRARVNESFAREASEVIAAIPDAIKAAMAKGETIARVLGRWLNCTDVSITAHPGGVDDLVEKLGPDGAPSEASLAGTAKAVFKWCEAEGLKLRVKGFKLRVIYVDKVPLNGPKYSLFVEPKGLERSKR